MIPAPVKLASRRYSVALGFLGLALGMVLSYGVLSGDSQGQVNFLFLLLVFVFLPVIALLFTLLLLLRSGGKGVAGWLLELPLWSPALRAAALHISHRGHGKAWLVYHSQIFSLCFALGSLGVYLLLLLATDITFVWRSTLLSAEQLFPVMQTIALPWYFWPDAQATMALLEQSQDFRLESVDEPAMRVGQWWRYILAAQFTYSLLPRAIMLLVARHSYHHGLEGHPEITETGTPVVSKQHEQAPALASVVSTVPTPYLLLDWAGTPVAVLETLQQEFEQAAHLERVGPMTENFIPERADLKSVVVLVKSWEPPLAELADFLHTLDGFENRVLWPLDFNNEALHPVKPVHLNEWRRFCATLDGWQILEREVSQ